MASEIPPLPDQGSCTCALNISQDSVLHDPRSAESWNGHRPNYAALRAPMCKVHAKGLSGSRSCVRHRLRVPRIEAPEATLVSWREVLKALYGGIKNHWKALRRDTVYRAARLGIPPNANAKQELTHTSLPAWPGGPRPGAESLASCAGPASCLPDTQSKWSAIPSF